MEFIAVLVNAERVYREKSLRKHPTWDNVPIDRQRGCIIGEFKEWMKACNKQDVNGPHGEIAELYDLIVVSARRIKELSR